MITMRMPTKEKELLGGLKACCFQSEELCNGARDATTGFCTRKDIAYGERRDRRKAGGGAATREARQREKAAAKEGRKRGREDSEAAMQARIEAARQKPCKKWLKGVCVQCQDVVAKYADGGAVGACDRPHHGTNAEGNPVSYADIPCKRRPCPFLQGECPYAGPHS